MFGRFVKDQETVVTDEEASEGEAANLATGKADTALANLAVKVERQPRLRQGGSNRLVAGILVANPDILRNRRRENVGVLGEVANPTTRDQLARERRNQADDRRRQGGLADSGGSDHAKRLARLHRQVEIAGNWRIARPADRQPTTLQGWGLAGVASRNIASTNRRGIE